MKYMSDPGRLKIWHSYKTAFFKYLCTGEAEHCKGKVQKKECWKQSWVYSFRVRGLRCCCWIHVHYSPIRHPEVNLTHILQKVVWSMPRERSHVASQCLPYPNVSLSHVFHSFWENFCKYMLSHSLLSTKVNYSLLCWFPGLQSLHLTLIEPRGWRDII